MSLLKDDQYTNEANQLATETYQALRSIFEMWIGFGYSIRDIEYIMKWAVSDLSLDHLLDLNQKKKKEQ